MRTKQKKNMLMRNNLIIRNRLPASWFMISYSYGFVILSAAPEDGIFGDFINRASQAPPWMVFWTRGSPI